MEGRTKAAAAAPAGNSSAPAQAPEKPQQEGAFPKASRVFTCMPLKCYVLCGEQHENEETIEQLNPTAMDEELVDHAAVLREGLPGFLMHREGGSIRCIIKLNSMRTALLLKAGNKGRTIPLEQIQSVFYGDELKRVDAFDADNTACVAIHLVSGSAIPIVFPDEKLKFAFLDAIESLQFGPMQSAGQDRRPA
ncbi:IMC subcompartment protein ISP4 [Besnoitia besnoiti]|uniref:IMC subcompartment protein ISP4 n=1 Tax=Besnoitia besnoiti TaxID=94643 RepID=A0A2A9MJW8_BESBE|nr:IMC subcompartment protein ISP4 [Besnoitia besnoiti]PFH35953.1 IMC subcompartment protein ISP4 [Besnoitia besnoiti]